MKRIPARCLLNIHKDNIWDYLVGEFKLLFDDGVEITTNYRETGYSSYFWEFHRQYPKLPLLHTHHVNYVLKGRMLSSGTHINLLSLIYWDAVDTYGLETPVERDPMVRLIYEVTNDVYNAMSIMSESFVISTDILDFIGAINHPKIKPILGNLEPTQESISNCYKDVSKILNTSEDLKSNALVRAVRSKMVNENQVLQCIGPVGYPTEVDGEIFKVPILRSYTQGMRSMYNLIAESRSAAKSLYFSEAPLQDSEYFARRLQLLCMLVERIHYSGLKALDMSTGQIVNRQHGDCGSTQYVSTVLRPPSDNFQGDLKFMQGKYYLADDGTLKILKETDTHLLGKPIKFRSVINCRDTDPHAICKVCFGGLADNLNHETNVGHICSATLTQKTTQVVLSAKHYVGSSRSESIVLSKEHLPYFILGENENAYYLNPGLKSSNVRLIISQAEANGLTDILSVDFVEDIVISRISSIDIVGFETMIDGMVSTTPVHITQQGRSAMFSTEFLKYIKEKRWTEDNRFNFVFDISEWDYNQPIFRLPDTEYNYAQHSKLVSKVIESRVSDIMERLKQDSSVNVLFELYNLVNSKLDVNIAILEVVIYASMIACGVNDQYGLARNSPTASLGVSEKTIKNRSLSACYAFEDQKVAILDPTSFYPLDRPDCMFDAFLCPEEVVKMYKGREF